MWARVSGCAGLAADCARLHTSARVLLRVPIHRAVCPPPVARRGSRFLSLTPRKLEESKDQTPAAAPAKPPVTFSSWVVSVVGRLTGIESRGQVLRRSAEQLYNACPNPSQIYALCSLPDTFQSWFLVMHLHVLPGCICRNIFLSFQSFIAFLRSALMRAFSSALDFLV
eukprot:m.878736 g.878736  ORF g.878736 m.878736 type:complete len:169 (-) comp59838_c0_seq7:24-530(-)